MINYSRDFALDLFTEITGSVIPSAPVLMTGSAPMCWRLNRVGLPGDLDIFINSPEAYDRIASRLASMVGPLLNTGGSFIDRQLEHIVRTSRSNALSVNLIHTQLPNATNSRSYAAALFETFDCDIAQIALTRGRSYIMSEAYKSAVISKTISFKPDALPNRITKYRRKFQLTDFEIIV